MGFFILDSTARATWAAGTSQTGQINGLIASWAGQMSVRYYSAAGAHLATVTHATPIVDTTTTPYSLRLGAWVAESHVQDGTAAYCILAVPAGADILRCDVSLVGAISDPGGRVRLDIGTTLRVQATSTLPETSTPAWRTAMTVEDTLYYVSAGLPSTADSALQWPGRGSSAALAANYATNENYADDLLSNYSSGTILYDDAGANGSIVFGAGGHTRLQNQLVRCRISEDAPTWDWFQDALYETSNTGDGVPYWDPTTAAGYAITRVIPPTGISGTVGSATTPSTTQFTPSALSGYASSTYYPFAPGVDVLKSRTLTFSDSTTTAALRGVSRTVSENSSGSLPLITLSSALPATPVSGDTFTFNGEDPGRWDRAFPFAFSGWIYPSKITTGELAPNAIHGYRYNCVAYVPPSLTGWGSGGFIATNHGPQGPFSQSWKPTGLATADLCDAEAIDSGSQTRLDVTCAKNITTGAWVRVPGYMPHVAPYGEFISPTIVVSSRTQRAYVLFIKAGQEYGFRAIDLSGGIASATYDATWRRLLGTDGGAAYPSAYSMAAFTEGYSRDLLYSVSDADSTKLVLMDLDNVTATGLAITNTQSMRAGGTLMYDKNNHRLLHVAYDTAAGAFRVVKISIPADPTDASGYTVSTTTIAVDASVSFSAPSQTDWFGRISYHHGLDVVLIARSNNRLQGFVPA